MLTPSEIAQELTKVRTQNPLVHNITNYVVMNFTANALLALGASPVMAHAIEEVEDMVGIAGALVINMGTLSAPWVESMVRAMRAARAKNIPVVFDPVGVGATKFRDETAHFLLHEGAPTIIRGNASEIMALQKYAVPTKGVDSTQGSHAALSAARDLSRARGCVVCVSGAVDLVVHGDEVVEIHNGSALMTKVTGMGCAATAAIGAFAAVNPSAFMATQAAMAVMALAGEKAARESKGPGSLGMHFLDGLFLLNAEDLNARLRMAAR